VSSTHSNFFEGEMERGLFYWLNHSLEMPAQLRRRRSISNIENTNKILFLVSDTILFILHFGIERNSTKLNIPEQK
jgi:hypothetical protein